MKQSGPLCTVLAGLLGSTSTGCFCKIFDPCAGESQQYLSAEPLCVRVLHNHVANIQRPRPEDLPRRQCTYGPARPDQGARAVAAGGNCSLTATAQWLTLWKGLQIICTGFADNTRRSVSSMQMRHTSMPHAVMTLFEANTLPYLAAGWTRDQTRKTTCTVSW